MVAEKVHGPQLFVPGGHLQISRPAFRPQSVWRRFLAFMLLALLVCAVRTKSYAQGYTMGQGIIGNNAEVLGSSPARLYASAFTGPTNGDYCDKVFAAFTSAPQGAIVYGDITGNKHCTTATAQAMLSNCANGYLQGQNTQLYIDVAAGSLPMIPVPSKCGGIRGIGRADQGGAGFAINACTGLNTPIPGCAAPTVRNGSINSMTVSGNYVDINYTLSQGPAFVGGELVQVAGVGDLVQLTLLTITGGNLASFANSGTNTFVSGQTVVLSNLPGTQGAKLNGMPCVINSGVTTTTFSCPIVATPVRGATNVTNESETGGLANPVNNAMYRSCQKTNKTYSVTSWSITGSVLTANGSGTPSFSVGESIVLTMFATSTFLNGQYVTVTAVASGSFTATVYFSHNGSNTETGQAGSPPVTLDSNCPANPTSTNVYVVNPLATTTAAGGAIRGGTGLMGISTSTSAAGTFGFAQRFEDLHVDCDSVEGLIGLMNYSGEEQSGWSHTIVANCPFSGWDIHTNFAQNSGPYVANEIYVNTNVCHEGTINAFIADSGIAGLQKITFSANSCGAGGGSTPEPNIGLLVDNSLMEVRGQIHCEGVFVCVEVGQDIGVQSLAISTAGSQPSNFAGNSGIDISGNFCGTTSGIVIEAPKQNTGALDIFVDHCQTPVVFNNEGFFASYAFDFNASLENRITTSPTIPNLMEGGLAFYRPLSPHTASYSVLPGDSDTILTNEGAVGAITYTLPTCNASNTGAHYYFEVDAAQQEILAFAQKFRLGGFLSPAGPNITGATTGARLGAQCLHSTNDGIFEWLITDLSPQGSWTIGAGPLLGSGATGASTSVALSTASVGANTCTTNGMGGVFPLTVEGVLTTSVIGWSFAATPVGVTGYGTGAITVYLWPSAANTISETQCNTTASAILPGAINVNIKVLQ